MATPPNGEEITTGIADTLTSEKDAAAAPTADADDEPPRTVQITLEDVAKFANSTPPVSETPTPLADTPIAASELPSPAPEQTPAPVFVASEPIVTEAPIGDAEGMHYCPECFVPLHPDPKPETLYIFLHALRYTTSLGCFETGMPEWAAEGWEWER